MKIFVNEKQLELENGITAYEVRDNIKKNADIVILNGFPIEKDYILREGDKLALIKKGEAPTKEELEFLLFSRHTPKVHEKVKKASVGIAGLGGLGSNVAISLARIGIGKLVLVDFDVVEPSNLNRQQYLIKHLGMNKTEAIKETISEINPFIEVETKNEYIKEDNVLQIFKEVDIIVEAFDNAESKAVLVNTVLSKEKNKFVVAASGMAGYFSNNIIKTKKINERFYLIGDETYEAKVGCGLMAPRVAIAANHQANTVLRIIMDEKEV
ncbi:sulfur carrier protein ThiS adenylyltransferase ThiF [Clostridium brassicae]|uniref:Sulfur carrier protein ThiS adenylyltransferase ThiF n=1 Tax=Clostridium brassicae TaxID=2999072 RepID=A0ABT4D9M4_9CLOT|nr:sulfur carrier protein ThiS adenylyltransferase ThiF [Clostridium brassicae]MCY6958985.1 sulfur carrier protein ThiS adenylyltransferase ThiF [Clostridium brassicae]